MVNDPNRGQWNFLYNGFGELRSQTDARSYGLSLNYDSLGRLFTRSWTQAARNGAGTASFTDQFNYENALNSGRYGTLTSTSRSGGQGEGAVQEQYGFDALLRPVSTTYIGTGVDGYSWNLTESAEYDPNFGRPVRKRFPAYGTATPQSVYMGYTLGGDFMQTGYTRDYLPSDPRSSNANRYLYRAEASNARGQNLQARFGSGNASSNSQLLLSEYDESTGWLLSRCSGSAQCSGVLNAAVNNGYTTKASTLSLGYGYDLFGNLQHSANVGQRPVGVNAVQWESFGYDPLHRLVNAQRGLSGSLPDAVSYSYSAVGNLRKKTDFSINDPNAYDYGSTAPAHGVKRVQTASGGKPAHQHYGYDSNGNVTGRTRSTTTTVPSSFTDTFGFDIDNRPQWQSVPSAQSPFAANQRIDFYLSASGAKALQVQRENSVRKRAVIYAGGYEAELDGTSQSTATLSASRTIVAPGVLLNTSGPNQGLSFMHQDRLGSTLVITDNAGQIQSTSGKPEFRSFDAFGKARDNAGLDTNAGLLNFGISTGARSRAGFTGHEHLDEVGLIHMNGRAYDYNLGRFYGVDPIIQFPTNSQSLNGYSYILNNPLSGTDPTGYCAKATVEGDNVTCTYTPIGSKTARTATGTIQSDGSVKFKGGDPRGGLTNGSGTMTLTVSNGAQTQQGSTGFQGAGRQGLDISTIQSNSNKDTRHYDVHTPQESKTRAREETDAMAGDLATVGKGAVAIPVIAVAAISGAAALATVVDAGATGYAGGGIYGAVVMGGEAATPLVAGVLADVGGGTAAVSAMRGPDRVKSTEALKAVFIERARQLAGFTNSGKPIILDHNLSPKFAQQFRDQGYNVRSVTEIFGTGKVSDPRILDLANMVNAQVLTRDRGKQLDGGFFDRAINVDSRVNSYDGVKRVLDSGL